MTMYELLQEGPEVYIPFFIISLVSTVLVYGAFPFIFAKKQEESITKKKYRVICFVANIWGIIFFAIISDNVPSLAPYLLWTWVFSKYGIKILGQRGILEDVVQDVVNVSKVQTKNSELTFGDDIKLDKTKSYIFSDKDYETMLTCISYVIEFSKDGLDELSDEEKEDRIKRIRDLYELGEVFQQHKKPDIYQNILAMACLGTCIDYAFYILDKTTSPEEQDELLEIISDIRDVAEKLDPYKYSRSVQGSEQKEEASKLNPKGAPNTENVFYCRKCGNKLLDDSIFCNKCGTKIIKE